MNDKPALAIDASFRALLASNYEAARRALASAQVDHYGLKPWSREKPLVDALGRSIVYAEDGRRYAVRYLLSDGSHLKIELGSAREPRLPQAFTVYAHVEPIAVAIAEHYTIEENLHEVRLVDRGTSGEYSVVLFYNYGRSLD